jgi:hypothetical protein
LTILSGYAAYRTLDTPDVSVDVVGGLRYMNMDLSGNFQAGTAPAFSFASSDDWVDPLIGARVSAPINEKWTASAFFDVGGFGIGNASDLTWQVAATVRYQLNDKWSLVGGYRHFFVEQTLSGLDVELEVSGPVVGLNMRF